MQRAEFKVLLLLTVYIVDEQTIQTLFPAQCEGMALVVRTDPISVISSRKWVRVLPRVWNA